MISDNIFSNKYDDVFCVKPKYLFSIQENFIADNIATEYDKLCNQL